MGQHNHDNQEPGAGLTGLEVAVIGLAGRFPGANSVDEFWENLKNGIESISFFTREEMEEDVVNELALDDPAFVCAKGILENAEYFDSAFFGYTPAEAELMDPQMRNFYECVWWALENAGYSPDNYGGKITVVAGATNNRGWEGRAILSGKTAVMGSFASDHLVDRDFLSTRMAYRLNLTGPAITMKTACSSSLVATDLACRLLLTGQCDIALSGGSSVAVPIKVGYVYEEGMIKSMDGHVRAFDARSKGVVFSDGVGVVVLKRLEEAIADRDNIMAVIKGSAINNDGSSKGSFSAPGMDGQAEVIRAAHLIAEVDPETIDYVETHGTGTTIGDPIEIEGLTMAFDTDKRNYCALGSLKSNVGHLDTAAGIGALIKTIMSLRHKYIPPSLHFENPNPRIDFANSPFFVNTQLREWKRNGHPRRAGVSSFGVGGTNVHVILEEAPERADSSQSRENRLIVLSAKNSKALDQLSRDFREYLRANPGLNLADAAYTLHVGRSAFKHRQGFLASTTAEAIDCLTPPDDSTTFNVEKVFRAVAQDETRPVFMFSGQGSQYVDMGRELYREEPDFAAELDHCFAIFKKVTGGDIKEILYPSSPLKRSYKSHTSYSSGADNSEKINQTEMTQPLLFVFEYALAKLLMKWGVKPYSMIGHSIGEYVAACLSGVFSLEDAIKVVSIRGKLMQQMVTGAMLSVPLPESEVIPLLGNELELGAVNAPSLCVVSGPGPAVNLLAEQLKEKGLQPRILHTSHAFHSRSMEPMLTEFEREVRKVTCAPPQIPFISNLTGTWIKAEEATDPAYWTRHLRQTVRFADGLNELLKDDYAVFIEVGPGRALSTFTRQHPAKKPGHPVINLVRHPTDEISNTRYLLDKLGRLWASGQSVDWNAFYRDERRNRVPLPLYPFQRQYFWISREAWVNFGAAPGKELEKKKEMEEWFYTSSWKRSVTYIPETQEPIQPLNWLIFMDECGIGAQLARKLRERGHHTTAVFAGSEFSRYDEGGYTVNPRDPMDYVAILDALRESGNFPQRVLHLWSITAVDRLNWGANWNENYLDMGFYSLLYIAQALGKHEITGKLGIIALANRVHQVVGNEHVCPEKAAMMGPVNIIPQEFPGMSCRLVDLVLTRLGSPEEARLLNRLIEELEAESTDTCIAYRGNFRLVQAFEAVKLTNPNNISPRLRPGGVYLITGGLGGIGLVLARYLAKEVNAGLILTGRSPLPPRDEWEQWLSTHPATDSVSRKITQVRELEELGARVLVCSVDVSDYHGMRGVLDRAREHMGPVNGVIHAAGLPGGGVIQLKTREIADRVLLPKIRGTLVLDTLLKKHPLDFMLLCSSINSVVPMLGQVDYFGANAFLDAYSYYKTFKDNVFTVSVNWDSWQEVGMAVEAARGGGASPAAPERHRLEPPHPLLEEYITGSPEQRKYIGHLALNRNWPLNEHQTTDGKGLLPGTTYLEMARAAWENYAGDGPLEITSANFMIPLMVNPTDEREVYLHLENQGNSCQFRVESVLVNESGEKQFHQRHVMGEIRTLPKGEPRVHDIEQIKARCNIREFKRDEKIVAKSKKTEENKEKPQGLLVFGPRWKTAKWSKYGKNEGITMFELPEDYMDELARYKLHPALLDTSTGFMFGYASGGKAYIPFSYKNLKMFRPFPRRVISHCRVLDNPSSTGEFLKFNVIIMDEEGRECVEVEEFTMLEVSEDIKGRIKQKEHVSSPEAVTSENETAGGEELNTRQRYLMKIGIKPQEGIDAFRCILGNHLPQVVVSTTNLSLRLESQKAALAARSGKEVQENKPRGPKHSRPEISAVYLAPRSDIEKQVAEIWEEQLGISGVGIYDDFFELGGDSLKAITINGKIHKQVHVEIPLGEFFSNPTVKGLSEYILAHGEKQAFHAIEPVEEREYYALSPAQERLFTLYQLNPESTVYNLSRGLEFGQGANMPLVETAFRKLLRRHESLRTSFVIANGQPVQRVHDEVDFALEYYDLTRQNADTLENVAAQFVKPFDLSRAPLLRGALVKVNENKHLLLADIHHIVSDAHSLIIVFSKDLAGLYAGEELPPLIFQYKDFALWQNLRKHAGAMKKYESFWLEEFKTGVPELVLPVDFERQADHDFAGDWVIFRLEANETNTFRNMLLAEEATLFMGLLTVFNVLLFKLSGQEDIVVGTPVAGRSHPDLQPIIGMFVNMLVMRNFPVDEKSFRQFLQEIKARAIKAFENQDYQFEDLVEKLAPRRKPGRNPLFDVQFTLQSVSERSAMQTGSGSSGDFLDIETRASKFDLSLEIIEIGEALHCKFEYKTGLFNRDSIERYAEYFKTIVAVVTENKEVCLKDIAIGGDLLEPHTQIPEVKFNF